MISLDQIIKKRAQLEIRIPKREERIEKLKKNLVRENEMLDKDKKDILRLSEDLKGAAMELSDLLGMDENEVRERIEKRLSLESKEENAENVEENTDYKEKEGQNESDYTEKDEAHPFRENRSSKPADPADIEKPYDRRKPSSFLDH